VAAMHPIDTIKTIQQSHHGGAALGILGASYRIFQVCFPRVLFLIVFVVCLVIACTKVHRAMLALV